MSKISNISGVPKYRQLLNKLTASISSGEYPVGSQMPTETEVMMKFGVSRITVRNAMQHLESEGLIKRESGRGTFVLDDKKKTDSNSHIAFILIDVDQGDLFHFREIQLMERYLSSHGIPFSWAILTKSDLVMNRMPAILEKRLCSGLILDGFVDPAYFSLGERYGIKVVTVGNHLLPKEIPQVRFNMEQSSYQATLHLAQKFKRKVICLLEPMKLVFTREMHAGYLKALNELDQREEYTYLCPKDELPKGFVNLIDQVPTQFCILTTRLIYQNIRTLLMERGLNMKLVPMFIITDISLELEKSLPIWQYCFKPDALYDVAIEKLLAMIRGEETVVFEESPPEFIEPSQHIDPLTFAD